MGKKVIVYALIFFIAVCPVFRPRPAQATVAVLPFLSNPLGWAMLAGAGVYCYIQYRNNIGVTKSYKYEYTGHTKKTLLENFYDKRNFEQPPKTALESGQTTLDPGDVAIGDSVWVENKWGKVHSGPIGGYHSKTYYTHIGDWVFLGGNTLFVCTSWRGSSFANYLKWAITFPDPDVNHAEGAVTLEPTTAEGWGEVFRTVDMVSDPVITPLSKIVDPPTPGMVEMIDIQAITPDGDLVDDRGRVIPPPPGLTTEPGFDNLPVATGLGGTSGIKGKTGVGEDIILPPDLADALQGAGVPAGSVITGVSGGVATWVDTAGNVGAVPIPSAIAQGLSAAGVNNPTMADSAPPATGTGEGVDTDVGEWSDPSDPSDGGEGPDFDWTGLVVPSFNSTINIPEKEPIPVDSWWDSLPVVGIFSDHTITLDGASSQMTFDLAFFDQTRTVNFDFADWEHIFIVMGQIILGIATYRAILLALTRRLDI